MEIDTSCLNEAEATVYFYYGRVTCMHELIKWR